MVSPPSACSFATGSLPERMRRPDDPLVRSLVAAAGVFALIAVVVAITGGISFRMAGISIRSHDPVRPLVAAALLFLAGLARGGASVSTALEWCRKLIER